MIKPMLEGQLSQRSINITLAIWNTTTCNARVIFPAPSLPYRLQIQYSGRSFLQRLDTQC